MKIAYVSTYDSDDIHAWSGLGYHIRQAIENAGFDVIPLGGLKTSSSALDNLRRAYWHRLGGKVFLKERTRHATSHYARQIEKRLASVEHDLVFCPGTLPICRLRSEKPIAFWTDAVFGSMVDFYRSFSNLAPSSLRDGNRAEQEALGNCSLALFASDWAASEAILRYGAPEDKVHAIPFGANIAPPATDEIAGIARGKDRGVCRLLLLGVDWVRKGGDIATEATRHLIERGIPAELHVVGCQPPADVPDFVTVHGFISKKTAEGRARLDQLLKSSHFHILPSKAECYGLAFAEASAYGLPSVATKVGGIPTVIAEGRNGWLFESTDPPKLYADAIEKHFVEESRYLDAVASTRSEYDERLNWKVAGERFREIVDRLAEHRQRSRHPEHRR